MKKYSLFITLILLVFSVLFGFLYWRGNAENENSGASQGKENKKIMDIEKTIVECKNKEQYLGKDLIGRGLNFQLIESKLFYKGEELERLCNPSLGEYKYEAEPSFRIIPAYIE
ncbi:MAG: hypothetical protein QG620_568 [Patescibacteria group bacterium]|nr:hypothetical protein [Patescibacteria group bacterium]